MLSRAGDEFIRSDDQLMHALLCTSSIKFPCRCDKALFSPFSVSEIHCFADAVSKCDEHISGFEHDLRLFITGRRQQSNDWPAGLQPQDVVRLAKNEWRVVSSVHIGQVACCGIVLRVKKRSVSVGW